MTTTTSASEKASAVSLTVFTGAPDIAASAIAPTTGTRIRISRYSEFVMPPTAPVVARIKFRRRG